MKYLLITRSRYSLDYQVEEFDNTEKLTAKLLEDGVGEDAIIAQRLGIQLQICEWAKPEEQPQEEPLQEAA